MIVISDFDSSKLEKLFAVNDSEWVTIVCTQAGVLLATDTNEVFAALQFKSVRAQNDTDFAIRISKSILQPVILDGMLEIECGTEDITFRFIHEDYSRCITMQKHQAFVNTLTTKLKQLGSCDEFNASALHKMDTLSRRFKTFSEVTNGYASILLRDGTCILQKVGNIPNFALTASAMHALFQCSDTWFCNGTNIFAIDGNFGVLVTQCRGASTTVNDLLQASEAGAAAVFTADFSEVEYILQKYKQCTLAVDVKKQIANISNNDVKISVNLPVIKANYAENFDVSNCILDAQIFTDIVAKLAYRSVTVRIKKYFTQLECSGFVVLCK